MFKRTLPLLLTLALLALSGTSASAQLSQSVPSSEIPAAPIPLDQVYLAMVGDDLIILDSDSGTLYSLVPDAKTWNELGSLEGIQVGASPVGYKDSLILVGGNNSSAVLKVEVTDGQVSSTALPHLPESFNSPAAGVYGDTLYVAGSQDSTNSFLYALDLSKSDAQWISKESPPHSERYGAFLVKSVETLSFLGGETALGETGLNSLSYHQRYGWTQGDNLAPSGQLTSVAKLGDAHVLASVLQGDRVALYLYHSIGDTWISVGEEYDSLPADSKVVAKGNTFYTVSQAGSLKAVFGNPETNYGWWDHLSVALYFLVMLWVGFHFAKQSKSSEDYFRGGHKIPWWATGMSLFATGASAMSLMAMPGKSYASNWAFFAISIYSIIALPIAMYFFAPVIRKLNFGTAFEYLEARFGLSVRLIGSSIFAVYQILGRMGGVLLLPSFALEAIAGIPMHVSVPIMGLVTIAYTFLGGLSAVIWTDTLQGLVMITAVAGCLILVYFKIDVPFNELWTSLEAQDKLHVFDWGFSLTEENVFTVFIGIVFVTLLGIGDQNFVQRVQCSSSLTQTRKAVATQMAVAVPINLLLFALGTALFLFYKQAPEELNPVMKNDGIYPFFAAQQLPPGASGLVIAALLAATMSTISSSICSVSNLAVDDVYKRFSSAPTEQKAISVGRIVTVLVGLFGIGSAFYLNSFETPSIWDLALRVVSIVTATTVGIYTLGLFTQKANEIGVLVGIACGMASTYWISVEGLVVFWLYPVVGSFITVAIGYLVSLLTGGNQKNIEGLTLKTLHLRKGGLDD